MEKKKIAVLFGGQSSEHEVSCVSAATIISSIDTDKYDVILIGITKEGRWLKAESLEDVRTGAWRDSKINAVLSPDAVHKGLLILEDGRAKVIQVDVVFPALHGLYGEDGTVQGLLELAGIPYVGCGVVASAVAMDKFFTKIIADTLHIRQAKYVPVRSYELKDMEQVIARIEREQSYPVFVKPSNAGSSCGVSRAADRDGLAAALKLAAQYDKKILVEEAIIGREVECAVLGGNDPKASEVGEILAAADFYDYDAKYNSPESRTVIAPELPEGVREEIRRAAVEIFRAVDAFGLSRVDFFIEKDTNEVVFNEINTLPGFTAISMYPMLWEAMGISKRELVDRLIELASVR